MKIHPGSCGRLAPFIAVLLAGILPLGRMLAQPTPPATENRFLLVFDTSSAMKKRLPAVQHEVSSLLATSMRGQLQPGDTIGIWTFGKEMNDFPMQHWVPQNAATIAANINGFVAKQHFKGKTSLQALPPYLNLVIAHSERLTVVLFCDGDGEINWSPYNDAINQIFRERQAEREKAREPFVLVMRTQLGHFVGCTMSLPPEPINIPAFPPLPVPPPPPPPPPKPVAAPVGAPLIIVGTKVETNLSATVPLPAATNTPAPVPSRLSPTNTSPKPTANSPHAAVAPPIAEPIAVLRPGVPSAPLAPTGAPITNLTLAKEPVSTPAAAVIPSNTPPPQGVAATVGTAPTNMVTPAAAAPLGGTKGMVIGAVFLCLAGSLVTWMFHRSRRDRSSLITRSMNVPPGRSQSRK